MLVTAKEVLADARANQYALAAFDCVEDVMVRAVLETAEDCNAPVYLMCLMVGLETGDNGWIYIPALIKAAADHHKIPVVLHLDHAQDLESIRRAVDAGFTSVMIDGSSLPFEENVELTRAAAEIAHPRGVSIEGELGHVGGTDLDGKTCADNILTESDQVTRFVEQTGVDSLAVSIGTSHGVYTSLPNLNIERLAELNEASPVPLVLHGGSGTPDDQIRQAVKNGICKLNIFADLRMAMGRGVRKAVESIQREDPLPADVFGPIKREVTAVIREKIELLGGKDRA